jgi:signal transduction histidine kinase
MRKLRRLPWRIPKSNHSQRPDSQTPDTCRREADEREMQRERENELRNSQPVAFSAGRYVYSDTPSVPRNTEIRRKVRHRLTFPFVPAS